MSIARSLPWARLLSAAAVALALCMLALVLVPARLWHHPINDAVYQGFDPNLAYLDPRGDGSTNGIIDMSSRILTLTALPGSQPTVDLVTSPLSFGASMNVQVLQAGSAGSSLSIGIWSPTSASGYYIKFGSSAADEVSAEVVGNGGGSKTLVGGKVLSTVVLGKYAPGQRYHVQMALDKKTSTIDTSISKIDPSPFSGRVLRAGNVARSAEDNRSSAIPVVGGREYKFGGWVDYLAGTQPYAIGILWSDERGASLPFLNWWRDPAGLNGWTRRDLTATAPTNATTASVFLGSGAGSVYLFTHIHLEDATQPRVNLLPNGDFSEGAKGWITCRPPGDCSQAQPANVVEPQPLVTQNMVNATQFPQLFSGFRPTLAVSLQAQDGVASAAIDNYTLILPSQPDSVAELVEKIDDSRARLLTILLSVLGGMVCSIALGVWLVRSATSWRSITEKPHRIITMRYWPLALLTSATIVYLLLNSFLFRLGSPHFDTFTPKVWSYLAAQNGFLDLYHRPLLIPAAAVQSGVPWHDAVFPYGPTKAYYYLFIGWLYRLTVSPPGSLVSMDTFQLEFLLKLFNVLFALGDALLIYSILGQVGVGPVRARHAVALFILSPALLFIMSVWGSTETISLFFILMSVWLAQKKLPAWAWITLTLGAFTRPQMLVLAFLLGCVYLRKFSIPQNIAAISWAVVVFFVVVSPLSLAISPSLPVDYVSHVVGLQLGSAQVDPTTQGTSPGLYSIWTLPLMYVNGQHGIERMWYPRTADLLGSITYGQASTILVIGFLIAVGLLILRRNRSHDAAGEYLPLIALGMFGWLMLGDSLISRYCLYALVLVILCRKSFGPGFYFSSVAWLTIVVFVTSWSHLSMDVPISAPINPHNSPITRALLDLFSNDRFITVGTVLNMLVLALIGFFAIKGDVSPVARGDQREFKGVATPAGSRAIAE